MTTAGNPPGMLGRKPRLSDRRALMTVDFLKTDVDPPAQTKFWKTRAPFPVRSFGNLQHGDCTIAKQAQAALRMERIETRRTPRINDQVVIDTYYSMTKELYGGGDVGAYEIDALNRWRDPAKTFRDASGRPLTIDAYTRLDPANHRQMKQALALAGAHGIAVCLNLPWGFASILPPGDWDIPEGQAMTGEWEPGSWGGHSMWARDYDQVGIWLVHTWDLKDQRITWRAAAAYLDEAHLIIDSMNYWRKHKPKASKILNLKALEEAVNDVSRVQIGDV